MRRLMLALLATAIAAGPAAAQATAPKPDAVPDPDKKICRRDQALGSFLPKRVCHTRAEWATLDRSNAAAADSALSNRRLGMPRRN